MQLGCSSEFSSEVLIEQSSCPSAFNSFGLWFPLGCIMSLNLDFQSVHGLECLECSFRGLLHRTTEYPQQKLRSMWDMLETRCSQFKRKGSGIHIELFTPVTSVAMNIRGWEAGHNKYLRQSMPAVFKFTHTLHQI